MSQDDDTIAALFRDAAADAPPAGFGHDQVLADSRRITARRRSALIGAAAALVVVAGAAIGIGVVRTEQTADSAAMPTSASAESAPGSAADTLEGGPAAAARTPLGPSPSECGGGQDPDLRALVDAALPEVAGAPEAATTQQCRPAGERRTSLEVVDAGATGLLNVIYLPPGSIPAVPEGTVLRTTASGGSVLVSARGEQGGEVPFADDVEALADALAPQL